MLLALVGITGVGKSYFKDLIAEKLGFSKVTTIRTRKMRIDEQNSSSNSFITPIELEALKKNGEIVYDFNVFGGTYAYKKSDIFSDKNMVFEMHYTTIYDWKKIRPDIKTIYLMPHDIEMAKEKTKKRNLSPEKEIERLKDIDEHYNKICTDENFRKMFDYIVVNNYDKKSEDEVLTLVKSLVNSKL